MSETSETSELKRAGDAMAESLAQVIEFYEESTMGLEPPLWLEQAIADLAAWRELE